MITIISWISPSSQSKNSCHDFDPFDEFSMKTPMIIASIIFICRYKLYIQNYDKLSLHWSGPQFVLLQQLQAIQYHYDDVIMSTIASQTTSLTIVYSTVYSGAYQSKHQSSASLAFVGGIHRGPVNSPHKWPVTRKMFPFDDVIMIATQPP